MANKDANVTILEQLKKLDEQRTALLNQATTEAKKKLDDALAEYNSLGFNVTLSEGAAPGKKASKTTTRTKNPDAPCAICNFVTDPPHDGRMHRGQGEKKKPFTAAELTNLGLKKR